MLLSFPNPITLNGERVYLRQCHTERTWGREHLGEKVGTLVCNRTEPELERARQSFFLAWKRARQSYNCNCFPIAECASSTDVGDHHLHHTDKHIKIKLAKLRGRLRVKWERRVGIIGVWHGGGGGFVRRSGDLAQRRGRVRERRRYGC